MLRDFKEEKFNGKSIGIFTSPGRQYTLRTMDDINYSLICEVFDNRRPSAYHYWNCPEFDKLRNNSVEEIQKAYDKYLKKYDNNSFMIQRYKRFINEVEVLQWTGDNHREMHDFLGGPVDSYMVVAGPNFYINHNKVDKGLVIKTPGGEQPVPPGHYVVKEGNDYNAYPETSFRNLFYRDEDCLKRYRIDGSEGEVLFIDKDASSVHLYSPVLKETVRYDINKLISPEETAREMTAWMGRKGFNNWIARVV